MELKAFFSAFGIIHNQCWNTKISYDNHIINFTSHTGDAYNLKFKNDIIEIFPIINGIIIKMIQSLENIAFFKHKHDNITSTYQNYILFNHPLSSMSPLVFAEECKSGYDIIKTSKKYPILLTKDINNKLKVFLILSKQTNKLQDFESNIKKMINSTFDPFNLGEEHSSQFPSEITASLLPLAELPNIINENEHIEGSNSIRKVKIFTSYSSRYSIFISVLNNETLYIHQIKFKENDIRCEITNAIIIPNVLYYETIDSIINKKNEKCYEIYQRNKLCDCNGNINRQGIMKAFLMNKEENMIYNKTLCYLGKENTLFFCESGRVIMKYLINDLPFQIREFRIKDSLTFEFFNNDNKQNEDAEAAIYLNYSINDNHVLFYLQFIKMFYSKQMYFSFLNNFYQILLQLDNDEDSNHSLTIEQNHLEIIAMLLCECFNSSLNENFTYKQYNIINNHIAHSSKFNLFSMKQSNDTHIIINQDLRKSFLSCQSNTIQGKDYNDNKLLSMIQFTKGLYENIKVFSYYNFPDEHILINFMINLLTIYNQPSITFQYLTFLSTEYDIIVNSITLPLNISEYATLPSLSSFLNSTTNHSNSNSNNYDNSTNDTPIPLYSFYQCNNIASILHLIKQPLNDKMDIYEITVNPNDNHHNPSANIINSINIDYDPLHDHILLSRLTSSDSLLIPTIHPDHNFLTKILCSNYTMSTIKNLHPSLSLIILQEIAKVKSNPFNYLTKDKNTNMKILSLIDRLDLAKNIIVDQSNEPMENLTSMLYKNETSDYDSEYYLTKIKFDSDSRIREVNRILSPTRILKIDSTNLSNIVEAKTLEIEKMFIVQKNLIKQYTACIGNGALNLNTIKTFPKEVLTIKQLNTQCFLTHDESNFKFDKTNELIKDKEFTQWTEFHNGVAQSLKLSTENFSNKSYIRNWILFNKPTQATYEHGGFLLGMGLLKQLDSLFSTEVYQYMKTAHPGVTAGILLGKSASKIGSMEETLSKTLCLHIPFLVPSTFEMNIPMTVQCSAAIGIGLVYMSTGNRLTTDMLLNQIGKFSSNDKRMDLKHIESYNLCLGFAIGLINLGLGKANTNEDLNFDDKLLNFANGKKTTVNVKLSSPSAFACLTLSYLQSRNSKIANRILLPENIYQLDSYRPFSLYQAILAKNLIMWDSIAPSIDWIMSQIPLFIRFLYENPISTILNDLTYSYKINQIEFSQVATCYYYAICAAVFSIGFKYCGTSNKHVSLIITQIVNKIRKVHIISDIIIKDNVKYNDSNKYSLNKTMFDECLCICSYAISIIMSGSGDLDSFKLLRILRKKVDSDYKSFIPGYSQAINQAIGMLFLGSGGLTFNQNLPSLAFLYISTFPIFGRYLNDNESYLQPLRHLYVLSCESKLIETRDIETNQIIQSKIKIHYDDGSSIDLKTPTNIDNTQHIAYFSMKNNPAYYDIQTEKNDLFPYMSMTKETAVVNLMKTKQIFIKKRSSFNQEIELGIEGIDINNLRVGDVITALIKKMKDYVQLDKNDHNTKEIRLFTEKISEQIEYVLNYDRKKNNSNSSNELLLLSSADIVYMKSIIVFFVKYIQKDNLNSYMIINDKLNELREELRKNNSTRFDLFEFFIMFDIGEFVDDFNVYLCIKEIKKLIYQYILTNYEMMLRSYLLLFSGKQSINNNNNNEGSNFLMMKILKLTKISFKAFTIISQLLNINQYNTIDFLGAMIMNSNDGNDNIILSLQKELNDSNYDMFDYLLQLIKSI